MTDLTGFTDPARLEAVLWEVTEPGVPLNVVVTLTIEPDQRSAYLAALREVLPLARAEPSCLYLKVGHAMVDPNIFILSESWTDLVEYRDVVLQKPYFQKYLALSEKMYAAPRVAVPLIVVE